MIEKLEISVDDITSLNSKLALPIGPPRSGKSGLLAQLSERRDSPVPNKADDLCASLGDGVIDIPKIRGRVEDAGHDGASEVEIFPKDDWWRREPDDVLATCIERHRSAV